MARRPDLWIILAMPAAYLVFRSYLAIHTFLNQTNEYFGAFGSFWSSGRAASEGLNPYGYYPPVWHGMAFPGGPMLYDVNLNPPVLLPLFQLFARFPIRDGGAYWTLISLLLFISGTALLLFTARPLLQKRKVVWLLMSVATIETVALGQIYALPFFLCCCIATWMARDKPPAAIYVVVGLVIAMKPNFGLWIVVLFLLGYKIPAFISASTAFILSVVPIFIYKPSIYPQWLLAYAHIPHYIFPTDVSIAGMFTRLGSRPVGLVLSIALGAALLFFVHRMRPSEVDVSGIALCAGVLCSPLAWFHYSLLAAPFFAVSRRWGRLETCAAALMFAPDMQGYVMNRTARTPLELTMVSLPYFVGISLMLISFMKQKAPQAINVYAPPPPVGPVTVIENG
jgi:hypothetical protein